MLVRGIFVGDVSFIASGYFGVYLLLLRRKRGPDSRGALPP